MTRCGGKETPRRSKLKKTFTTGFHGRKDVAARVKNAKKFTEKENQNSTSVLVCVLRTRMFDEHFSVLTLRAKSGKNRAISNPTLVAFRAPNNFAIYIRTFLLLGQLCYFRTSGKKWIDGQAKNGATEKKTLSET